MSAGKVDLIGAGVLPPIPAALLNGAGLELLRPLAFDPDAPITAPPVERRELAAALAVANSGYGHPAAAELARKLADPATLVVVTGQQPGLFGGPLYTLSKAVAASLWAERLEAEGQPAVAAFWVATEDHDFREVASSVFLAGDGPLPLELGEDPSPLMPVGMRTLGPRVGELLDRLRDANPGERWAEWVERLATWYRPDARFGEAFSRLIVGLMGARSPLMVDSMLPELKSAQRPWLRRLVEERRQIEAAFEERDREIVDAGFDLQVKPAPGASPLFLLRGESRRRIEYREGGRIGLRGEPDVEHPVEWLLEAIDDNPAVVSPGVMARVALQDAALGTALLVLGPGEVSYLPQVAPLYDCLGIQPPRASLRPQALVLGRHQADKLGDLQVTLEELVAVEFDLDRSVSRGAEEDVVEPVREAISGQLDRLRRRAAEVDPNLTSPWEKTSHQVNRALDAFTQRLASAVARHHETRRQRLRDLRDTCRPLGTLQERALSTAHFPGKYGEPFVDSLFEQLELEPRLLHVITP